MIEEFHKRYLAKATAMDFLSKFAGLTDGEIQLTVTPLEIERSDKKRRGVVLALIEAGYLESGDLGQRVYPVTLKAFEECGVEPYIGELNIGTRDKPLATWLSAEVMKQAITDLAAGSAVIEDCMRGKGKIVRSIVDARSDSDRAFDDFLFGNFGDVVCAVTEMSNTFAENLRFQFTGVTSKTLPSYLLNIVGEQEKEIQRLKRRNDALKVLCLHVDDVGGWDEFLSLARLEFVRSQAKSA